MSEQEKVKVYELAKELGVDSISLLDQLKNLNIKVKNHMSELGDEDVRVARSALRKGSDGGRKTTGKTSGAKTSVTRTRKKTADMSAPAAASAESSTEKKAASPIIRRRMKADGVVVETIAHLEAASRGISQESSHQESFSAAPTQAAHTMHEQTVEAIEPKPLEEPPTTNAEIAENPVEMEASAPAVESDVAQQTETHHAPQQDAAPLAPPTPASTAPSAPTSQPQTVESQPTAPQPTASTQAPGATPPKPARPPIVFPPRPVAPRRSILKIVEPAAPVRPKIIAPAQPVQPKVPPKPATGTTADKGKDNFRIIKMTKENLDQMIEEEASKRRGTGAREPEIRPEDVRFADYRKKEMVFLPKKKKLPIGKEIRQTQITTPKAQKRVVEMQDTISVQSLASQLNVKAIDVIRKLMGMGQMVTINQSLDLDTASLVAAEYQYEVKNVAFKEGALLDTSEDKAEDLKPRPPVVTIMGHVDHGKTSLLDAIKETHVAEGEAGGITQHIGAYTVEKDGKLITFIDTPGHEAFTVMRARGANVTDIVVLVVAAEDGVMPQTREAVAHSKAAGVPIIVAVNKIDKPGANPDKVKQGLAELDLLAEDWGGQTMFIPVSAIKRTNLDKLLESILLQAEIMELRANPSVRASGTILEARLEKGRGPVVSVLVRRGTLHVGDPIVSGAFAGKVKAMVDYKGQPIQEVGPGKAAEVLGLDGVPNAGERFDATAEDADAHRIAENRVDKNREKAAASQGKMSLEALFSKIQSGDVKELKVILKADVFGSVEAIRDSLTKLSTPKVKVTVIHAATGGVTESDVLLASASEAIIIGFNVRPETKARQLAESEHVEIKNYNIIYELIDDIKKAMAGLLDKLKVEKFLGRAEVRQTFQIPKIGMIAGSSVIDGKIVRGANVRLLRDSRIIYEGKMNSLKRFKEDAKEVASGFECGIGLEGYNDLKPGDVIEAYQIEYVTPELSSSQ